ncbi:MAG: hypothetical protein EOP84_10655 [Verrucomicrobiaceae bacterium]|nr:MAG: hypothetical protein EOP84_10655 [Verrucomicrobiaceae bacterium]
MLPRPLHRWKSLWLCILVLALLGIGWVRSMSWTDGFFWFPEHFALTAYQSAGQIGFSWDQSRLRTTVSMFEWVHEPISSASEPWFPKAVVPEVYDRQFQFGIAHWFLMLLFGIPWIALLSHRVRRNRLGKSPM